MESMTPTQLVGHRLLVGLPGTGLDDDFIAMVRKYKISNFILMSRNIEGKAQLAALLARLQALVLQETGYPALIAMDQEGGSVARLAPDATRIPGAMAVAWTGRPGNARRAGLIAGQEMAALGVNFDLAPVLDVNSDPRNPVIGERSYGDTPETVMEYGLAMMAGLKEGGVLTCAKHFPGHGDTHVDSHQALPVITKDLAALRQTELKPFAAAIAAGVDAIMSSHIRMPALEPEAVPNTLSRRVMHGLLREEMGFAGLTVSDCLEMDAIRKGVGTARGAVMAAAAGVDLLCICHTPALMTQAAEQLRQALENGRLDRPEMEQAVRRVLDCKEEARRRGAAAGEGCPGGGVPEPLHAAGTPVALAAVGSAENRAAMAEITRAAMALVHAPGGAPLPPLGEAPLFVGGYAYLTIAADKPENRALCFSQWMAGRFGGQSIITAVDPGADEIERAVAAAEGSSCIVAGSYNGQFQPGQREMIRRLAEAGRPMVHVALRSPYDLAFSPANIWKLAAFEYTTVAFEALADIFSGGLAPAGRLSVELP